MSTVAIFTFFIILLLLSAFLCLALSLNSRMCVCVFVFVLKELNNKFGMLSVWKWDDAFSFNLPTACGSSTSTYAHALAATTTSSCSMRISNQNFFRFHRLGVFFLSLLLLNLFLLSTASSGSYTLSFGLITVAFSLIRSHRCFAARYFIKFILWFVLFISVVVSSTGSTLLVQYVWQALLYRRRRRRRCQRSLFLIFLYF